MPTKQYLEHVQGLRGLAILLIVLYHMLPSICPNGFLGVDVFLVISGYFLIGKQLTTEKSFVAWDFLKGKILRIFPPYVLLILGVTVVSALLMLPEDLSNTKRLIKMCLCCCGNQCMDSMQNSYFSTDTRLYPLMHLWYMGVLIQSYLIFGALFLLGRLLKWKRRHLLIVLGLVFTISLVMAHRDLLSAWGFPDSMTYYHTSARLWEFVLGGFVALLPEWNPRWKSAFAVLAAVALVALSFIPLEGGYHYVGIGALTGAILVYGGSCGPCAAMLRSKPLMWLGLVSFSLYLVHWPWICLTEYLNMAQLSLAGALELDLPILLTAAVFYALAEKPKYPLWLVIALWALAYGGYEGYKHQGRMDNRGMHNQPSLQATLAYMPPVPANSPLLSATEGIAPNHWSTQMPPDPLILDIGDPNEPFSFVVLGDSHACDIARGMHCLGEKFHWHGVMLNTYFLPYWGYELLRNPNAPGNFFNEEKSHAVLKWLKAHPELSVVIIGQSWALREAPSHHWDGTEEPKGSNTVPVREQQLRTMCNKIREMGRTVVLVTDAPTIPCETPEHQARMLLSRNLNASADETLQARLDLYEQKNANVNRIMDAMAQEGLCATLHREWAFFPNRTPVFSAVQNGILYFRDSHHLTTDGSTISLQGLEDIIQNILRTAQQPVQAGE